MSDHEYGAEDYGSQADDGDEIEIITDNEESEMDENHQGSGQHEKKKRVKIPDAERITSRFMTKYEKARILGTRAL